jgi:hypothetical protein
MVHHTGRISIPESKVMVFDNLNMVLDEIAGFMQGEKYDM